MNGLQSPLLLTARVQRSAGAVHYPVVTCCRDLNACAYWSISYSQCGLYGYRGCCHGAASGPTRVAGCSSNGGSSIPPDPRRADAVSGASRSRGTQMPLYTVVARYTRMTGSFCDHKFARYGTLRRPVRLEGICMGCLPWFSNVLSMKRTMHSALRNTLVSGVG